MLLTDSFGSFRGERLMVLLTRLLYVLGKLLFLALYLPVSLLKPLLPCRILTRVGREQCVPVDLVVLLL